MSVTLVSKPAGWDLTQGDFNADLKELIRLYDWPRNHMKPGAPEESQPTPAKALSDGLKDIQTLINSMQAATQVDPGIKDPYPG